jgi:cold shock CspA family protein
MEPDGRINPGWARRVVQVSDDLEVRRPDLIGVPRTGTVRWFKPDKGYGRVTADDGEVLFVHFSNIEVDGYRSLTADQRVGFIWRGGIAAHGRHHAEDVQLIDQDV